MLVSVCIVAYNEENTLPRLLEDIKLQDYDTKKIEIVFVDSISNDGTRNIMDKFKYENQSKYNSIQILVNEKKKQAAGWNVAIKNAKGDVIIRLDAHASIPCDFIKQNMFYIESGEYVVGGRRPNLSEEDTPWQRTLLSAESSMFGSSIASFRRGSKKQYVKTMFHAAYRKCVFDKIGGFNESLGRTEDNELHYRIREAGYKLCFSSDIISYQFARSNLKKMLIQKYGNGYWVGITLKACPKCLSIYHFVPALFVIGIVVTSILIALGVPYFALLMWGMYWSLSIIMAVLAVIKQKKHIYQILLPALFFMLHLSYGIGTLHGILKIPFWKQTTNYGK